MSRVGADLYPTPTRLALLRDVDAGNVVLAYDPDTGIRPTPAAMVQASGGQSARRVSAAVDEMERAGWIERPDRTAEWLLTDTGREVLAGRQAPHTSQKGVTP